MTLQHLQGFDGGVVVEFINEDYFESLNYDNPLFEYLVERLGSDEKVSSMISIRSETGSSSSAVQRKYFDILMNNTEINYLGEKVIVNLNNFRDYRIRRKSTYKGGTGNDQWEGFLFISIKGGQHETINSHLKEELLFNPACEYANDEISLDLNLVIAFFTLKSVKIDSADWEKLENYVSILKEVSRCLEESVYDSEAFRGNLLEYCKNHPSTRMKDGYLFDPIQVAPIEIEDFAIDDKNDNRNIDFTHDEAVNKDRYYWDKAKNTILTPSRPTNIFWSKHLSNMMQQNFSLDEYFEHQEKIVERRKELLGK
ncbi:hypothetical protein CW672_04410 [Macrococcoides caseolyticum]|nr:hypothetical protein CW672_04410 [Macrococcus caseolyticus]